MAVREERDKSILRLALYQPDIPPNAGTMIRLAACLGLAVDIIEPCGFLFGDRQLRRAGLDYLELAVVRRHTSWEDFRAGLPPSTRLVLLTTRAERTYADFAFTAGDVLLLGRETGGVPDRVHEAVDARLCIPMRRDARSLNVAIAAAMVLGEALRQTGGFPEAD